MENVENWYHGSFNLCVPVIVGGWKQKQQPGQRVLLRFPLPYRVSDAFQPGNGMKRSDARLELMHGFKKPARMSPSPGYTDLLPLLVKLYGNYFRHCPLRADLTDILSLLDYKIYRLSPATFSTYVAKFCHGLVALFLQSLFVQTLQAIRWDLAIY